MKTSTLTLRHPIDKSRYLHQVWKILVHAYSNVEGGLLFADELDLLRKTSIWKIATIDGRVVAVTVFKSKYGQKLVAMGIDGTYDKPSEAKAALAKLIESSLERAWMEVSEAAESFIMKYCRGEKYLIHHSELSRYLDKWIDATADGYHYVRHIAGIQKVKIAIGTPGYLL